MSFMTHRQNNILGEKTHLTSAILSLLGLLKNSVLNFLNRNSGRLVRVNSRVVEWQPINGGVVES